MWSCYVLANPITGHAYCGMTNNLPRRIRQHNREIKGGARATARCAGTWRVALVLCGFRSHREALQAEWRLKHPRGRRFARGGPVRIIDGLLTTITPAGARWTSRAPCRIADVPLYVCGDAALVERLEDHVPIRLHRCFKFCVGDAVTLWNNCKCLSDNDHIGAEN